MYKEWSSVNPHHDDDASSYAPVLLSSGVSALPGGGMSILPGEFQNSVEQLARPLLKESLTLSDVPAPWCVIQSFF